MEQSANHSTRPKSLGVSKLPQSILPQHPKKPFSSRVPRVYGLAVPKSRANGTRGENEMVPLQTDCKPLETTDQNGSQGVADSTSTPMDVGDGQLNEQDLSAEVSSLMEVFPKNDSKVNSLYRRPRPSLSERTIETLSRIPPSPSPQRRKSGIYPTENLSSNVPRAASSLSYSRSKTSTGQYAPLPSTPRTSLTKHHDESLDCGQSRSYRRSVSTFIPRNLPHTSIGFHACADVTPSKVPSVPKLPRDQLIKSTNHQNLMRPALVHGTSDNRNNNTTVVFRNGKINEAPSTVDYRKIMPHKLAAPGAGAKTFSTRLKRQRAPLSDLTFRPPTDKTDELASKSSIKVKQAVQVSARRSVGASPTFQTPKILSSQSLKVPDRPVAPLSDGSILKASPKSSMALRETISKAKAARRAAIKKEGSQPKLITQKTPPQIEGNECLLLEATSVQNVLNSRINVARTTGSLNIAALGLHEFPQDVSEMHNLEKLNFNDGESWFESVDLVRLIAADNEIEILEDWVFPNNYPVIAEDLDKGSYENTLRGLEMLDLHGNRLKALPIGLARLSQLAVLNLSRNRIVNECLDVICQIQSLRELRLAENLFQGVLDTQVGKLNKLEVLDLHDNTISDITGLMAGLVSLHTLNIAGNKITAIPFHTLGSISLIEIDASRNRLDGALIPQDTNLLPTLRYLNVSCNALTKITDNETISLPSLQVLNITENRIYVLPDMSDWKNLVTLTAGGNKIAAIPSGLTSLAKLKNLDLTCNNIRLLDNRLGLMESLTSLRITNNPLIERRLLSMNTDDLQHEFRNRLLPVDGAGTNSDESAIVSLEATSLINRTWSLKPGGVLDRSSTSLQTLEVSDLEPLAQITDIKSVLLHHNQLSCIPKAISLTHRALNTLDLSHNNLSNASYLPIPLSLPHLKSLNLSYNKISTLTPLLALYAPFLSLIDVSCNRLSDLPTLRTTFPGLTTLLASNNGISELTIENARGLYVLNLHGNAITHLEPGLGLLAAQGLRTLEVSGNKFRVPRRNVLEKGTDAVLAWLRGRIPIRQGVGEEQGKGKGLHSSLT